MISMTKSDDFMATAQGKRPAAGVLYFTNSKKITIFGVSYPHPGPIKVKFYRSNVSPPNTAKPPKSTSDYKIQYR